MIALFRYDPFYESVNGESDDILIGYYHTYEDAQEAEYNDSKNSYDCYSYYTEEINKA